VAAVKRKRLGIHSLLFKDSRYLCKIKSKLQLLGRLYDLKKRAIGCSVLFSNMSKLPLAKILSNVASVNIGERDRLAELVWKTKVRPSTTSVAVENLRAITMLAERFG
jgi:hypothetical protein